jgi:hypothetical protein
VRVALAPLSDGARLQRPDARALGKLEGFLAIRGAQFLGGEFPLLRRALSMLVCNAHFHRATGTCRCLENAQSSKGFMTTCAIKAKHWVLRHYLWVTIALLLTAFGAVVSLPLDTWQERLGILVVPFAFLIAVQKQKTEELVLFKQLFTEFNERFNRMNNGLYDIMDEPEEKALSSKERKLLFDYFNLCGEEYLFYKQGYIYPEVWDAWHNGMKIFRANARIRTLWATELETFSYYGFHWNEPTDYKCRFCPFR